jgi:hypothetical protein
MPTCSASAWAIGSSPRRTAGSSGSGRRVDPGASRRIDLAVSSHRRSTTMQIRYRMSRGRIAAGSRMLLPVLAGALALVLMAGDASAQFNRRGERRGAAPGAGERPSRAESMPVDLLPDVDYKLELLEEDLELGREQLPAWKAYADKVRAAASDVDRERRRTREPPGVPAQLDRLLDIARDRLTAVEEAVQAAKDLHAVLTEAQRDKAAARIAGIIRAVLVPAQSVRTPPGSRGTPP